jgi:hypothetical protein
MKTTITCADGFKHSTEAPVRVRVLPKGTHIEIKEYDRGTWDPLYSTPFAVEVEVVPA